MKLSEEILAHYLAKENAQIIFPDLQINAKEILELQCYQALRKIHEILLDETLEDEACFNKIAEIIQVIEETGGGCGFRHDFG